MGFSTGRVAVLVAGLLVLAAGACSDSTGGKDSPVQLSLQPQFPASYSVGEFDLAVDRVRVRMTRPPAEGVLDTVVFFPANSNELQVRVKVPIISRREVLSVGLELSAGSRLMFVGTRDVEVYDIPSVAPTIPLQYVGPGTSMTSLRIEPRDSALRPGETFTYRVFAFDGNSPVRDFYVGWSTSDPAHVPVDATGSLVVPGERGFFTLRVVSPTGIKDSTRVWISPPATAMTYVEGDEQTGAVVTPLAGKLVTRVEAEDGQGVPGVPVHFAALSGGSVPQPIVTTDADGFARNTVVLGPSPGVQLFEASASGLGSITFRATAVAGPVFRVQAAGGSNQQGTVGQVLPNPLVVRVQDAAGNIIAGVPITWQVTSGGGVLEEVDAQTDAGGLARGVYKLGTLPGTNFVRASVNGALFVDFKSTASAGPPADMDAVSGDHQTAAPGTVLAPFTVRVTDEFGNTLPGVTVHWSIQQGGGTLSQATATTDNSGRASVTYQLPNLPATAKIRATLQGTSINTIFTAISAAPPTGSSRR